LGAREKGFSMVEVMTTVGLIAVLIGFAVPSYRNAVEKRQITHGAELIVAFVNTIQSESIKRNRAVAVSYATRQQGSWCIGAVLGQSPCDCLETDPAAPAFCALEGGPWVLRHTDVRAENLIQSVSGDGAYVFDPVRGLLTDPADAMTLGLSAAEGQYQINLKVISTGKVSGCLPEPSQGIHGFQPCPQGL
jgi:prepilin-type N-terminal cleavage/methylation domain-containing protein